MKGTNGVEIIGWCIYCKGEIYEGQKHIIDENGNMLHKECDNLISEASVCFGD